MNTLKENSTFIEVTLMIIILHRTVSPEVRI